MSQQIYKYLFEIGQLKLVKRAGWWLAGVADPESVAEHSFRAAHIGFILAILEGADPGKTVIMCMLHDVNEARLTDLHKVSQNYLDKQAAEIRISKDQAALLPEEVSNEFKDVLAKFERNETLEANLAHDADALECLIQAHEYKSRGYQEVQDWIDNSLKKLKSDSARQIAEDCLNHPPSIWWERLKIT